MKITMETGHIEIDLKYTMKGFQLLWLLHIII